MGPLYHLTSRDDRIRALRESHRGAESRRPVLAKAVNRFASLLDGLRRGFIDDSSFIAILDCDLKEGSIVTPRVMKATSRRRSFTARKSLRQK